jgi:para-aminobenzoate synthetase component 1
MGGRLARDLVEVSRDVTCLERAGFWAVSTTFEGEWICARFASVVDAALPKTDIPWGRVEGTWLSSMDRAEYIAYVEEIRRQISLGWVYQVNACRELRTRYSDPTLLPLMQQILIRNPAPYASFLRIPELEIASASPELFLQRQNGILLSGPIKGTKRLSDPDPVFGEKDRAENIMIVDLIRNDLGQICETGSISVPHLLQSQDHPGLSHLVSFVQGRVREGITWSEIAHAILPPGSVSGAPKSSSVETISRIEELPRGPYCGALGWIEGDSALLSVAIRIFWDARDGFLRFGTGAGITWGSEAVREWEETELKADNLMAIAEGRLV